MVRIDQRNEAERRVGGTAVHGITKFSDRSKAELKHIFGYANQAEAVFERVLVDVPAYMGIEKFADWSDKYATPVRDQGYCGSCWAFSAVNQIESDAIRAGISTRENLLSVQQVTACDHHSHGCGGGTTERAYDYIMRSGGISYEQDYPYSDASHVEDDNTTSCIPSRISPKVQYVALYIILVQYAQCTSNLTSTKCTVADSLTSEVVSNKTTDRAHRSVRGTRVRDGHDGLRAVPGPSVHLHRCFQLGHLRARRGIRLRQGGRPLCPNSWRRQGEDGVESAQPVGHGLG